MKLTDFEQRVIRVFAKYYPYAIKDTEFEMSSTPPGTTSELNKHMSSVPGSDQGEVFDPDSIKY
jgi:hypothetical protein